MQNYIHDGEIHRLSHDWAYLIKNLSKDHLEKELEIIKSNFALKYATYLHTFEKEKLIRLLKDCVLNSEDTIFIPGDDFNFVYKNEEYNPLYPYATIALKFKRLPNDNLDEESLINEM